MFKQFLASTSIAALLLTSSSMVGAKAQVASNRATTPASQNSTTHNFDRPARDRSSDSRSTRICKSIPIPRPSVGGTRERIEAIQRCNEARAKEQRTPTNFPPTQPNPPQVPYPMR